MRCYQYLKYVNFTWIFLVTSKNNKTKGKFRTVVLFLYSSNDLECKYSTTVCTSSVKKYYRYGQKILQGINQLVGELLSEYFYFYLVMISCLLLY